jgi:hypothetical protein
VKFRFLIGNAFLGNKELHKTIRCSNNKMEIKVLYIIIKGINPWIKG